MPPVTFSLLPFADTHTAVDRQHHARGEPGVGQVKHGVGNVADAADVSGRLQTVEEVEAGRIVHRRLDDAGSHRVNLDVVRRQLQRQGAGDLVEAPLISTGRAAGTAMLGCSATAAVMLMM